MMFCQLERFEIREDGQDDVIHDPYHFVHREIQVWFYQLKYSGRLRQRPQVKDAYLNFFSGLEYAADEVAIVFRIFDYWHSWRQGGPDEGQAVKVLPVNVLRSEHNEMFRELDGTAGSRGLHWEIAPWHSSEASRT